MGILIDSNVLIAIERKKVDVSSFIRGREDEEMFLWFLRTIYGLIQRTLAVKGRKAMAKYFSVEFLTGCCGEFLAALLAA